MAQEHFDVVVVGTGFGSLFFVEGYLSKRPAAKILMLERGAFSSHAWQLEHGKNSPITPASTFRTDAANKVWNFTIGVGGGTNCWYAQTPRFHPSDFRMRSRYGVAQDWPLDYDELEPYYLAAETKMSVAGAPEMAEILPRSAPFPQPPHKLTAVDAIMRKAQPEFHVPIATARASTAAAGRPPCCASARCNLCPVNAKFTFENGFASLRNLPNVEIRAECEVTHLDHAGGVARAAVYRKGGAEHRVTGDLFVLGANAIHSPAILLRSGIDHPLTGVGIHEQVGYSLEVLLEGLDSLDGGTITTALNYSLYDGAFRKDYGGALIYFDNRWPHGLRKEYGRWRQLAPLVVVVEDLPQDSNRVVLDHDGMPKVLHPDVSEYAKRGVQESLNNIEKVLAPLPVERIDFKGMRDTESHIQGSLRMGAERASSVIDPKQVHHDVRNLVVVGSSVFPSGPNSNPSLSVAALSLRSAALLA
ncbi:GMC family oxidoreductase [Steroidobacter sp. S1-65]|uniref:GMC family oxidoreductase n=1 Tax=Steroidobacter gossypii TaxID=2805490 RepID=A0ABS1WRJ6_9GAMM|nr:GMC family oxidoreductase [Steroidobacter gossypii]MBM0103601.1 GMC family oxidoreductase [Steroidobacter gossypii]